jgi:hypothetical protein
VWIDKVSVRRNRSAADAERQVGAVRQGGIVKADMKAEGAGAQRHRGADAAEPDDAEILHAEPADQVVLDRAPGCRRLRAHSLVIEDDAAAQRQCQRHRMVGNLGRAVVGHIADENVARRRRGPVDLVVADAHAHDRAQPRKPRDVLGGDRVAHDHQPVDLGAVGGVELGQRLLGAAEDAHLGSEDLGFDAEIGDLPVFGIEHRYGHRHFLRIAPGDFAQVPHSSFWPTSQDAGCRSADSAKTPLAATGQIHSVGRGLRCEPSQTTRAPLKRYPPLTNCIIIPLIHVLKVSIQAKSGLFDDRLSLLYERAIVDARIEAMC